MNEELANPPRKNRRFLIITVLIIVAIFATIFTIIGLYPLITGSPINNGGG